MDELNLRGEVERLWAEVQEPIRISDDLDAYAVFVPSAVGFSGIHSEDGLMRATVRIDGQTSVTVGDKPQVSPVSLLPLQKIPNQDATFSLAIPAVVEEATLQSSLAQLAPNGVSVDIDEGEFKGLFEAKNILVSLTEADGISIAADVSFDNRSELLKRIDVRGWFDAHGMARFSAHPALDSDNKIIGIENVRLDAETSSALADTLASVLDLPVIREKLAALVAYDYSTDVANALADASAALNVELDDGVSLSGALDAANAYGLEIHDGTLAVMVRADGKLEARIGP